MGFQKVGLSAIPFIACILLLGYGTEQHEFYKIAPCFLLSFCIYWYWIFAKPATIDWKVLVFLGLAARVLLLFSYPSLSDDIYRYAWDGFLIQAGISPFQQLPTYYINGMTEVPGLTVALFEQLNSPRYYSVYPTLSQYIFATAVYIAPDSILGTAIVIRSFILFFETLTIWCLFNIALRLGHSDASAWKISFLYACNPLVIIELTNNLHTEAYMIGLSLFGLLLLLQANIWRAAILFGAALLGKFMPLIFYPVLLKKLGFRRMVVVGGISIGIFVFGMLLILPEFSYMLNMAQSVNLYFQKFEFNASIFYVLRYLEWQKYGYDRVAVLGPGLAVTALLCIAWLTVGFSVRTWGKTLGLMAMALVIHLLLSTTVHPWYILFPMVLSILAGQRYVLVWSTAIWVTYINYSYVPYVENLWVVMIEYAILFVYFVYEMYKAHGSKDAQMDNLS